MSVDDPDFAARIRDRDAESLRLVVRAYLPQVLRAARGAGLPLQLAEDVTQDTFVTFIETAHRFEGRSHVRTGLLGILYKKVAAARRGLRRDQEMDDIDDVFEQRFDSAGSWTRPPRPVDAKVYEATPCDGHLSDGQIGDDRTRGGRNRADDQSRNGQCRAGSARTRRSTGKSSRHNTGSGNGIRI